MAPVVEKAQQEPHCGVFKVGGGGWGGGWEGGRACALGCRLLGVSLAPSRCLQQAACKLRVGTSLMLVRQQAREQQHTQTMRRRRPHYCNHHHRKTTHAHLVLDLGDRPLCAPIHGSGQLRGIQRLVLEPVDARAGGGGALEAGGAEAKALLVLVVGEVGQGVEADLCGACVSIVVWIGL